MLGGQVAAVAMIAAVLATLPLLALVAFVALLACGARHWLLPREVVAEDVPPATDDGAAAAAGYREALPSTRCRQHHALVAGR